MTLLCDKNARSQEYKSNDRLKIYLDVLTVCRLIRGVFVYSEISSS